MDRTQQLLQTRTLRRRMSFKLAIWAGASMAIALVTFVAQPAISSAGARSGAQAIASQFLLWGLIDAGFALFGLRHAQQADRAGTAPPVIERELADRDKLLRVLHFSGKLNILWVGLGIVMIAVGAGMKNPGLTGHGVGVLIQGGFLMMFDRAFLKSIARIAEASAIRSEP
ncbi:hypothetical protein BH09PLA1_BH09PLA1_34410 [soil metagenome]